MIDSPLAQLTSRHGAITADYDGFRAPSSYGDPQAEYAAACTGAAMRDASHLGLLHIGGGDHLDFLHRMSTNDFRNAAVGQGLEAVLPDSRGRILELGAFYRLGPEKTLAVLGPGGQEETPAWLDRYLFSERVEFAAANGETALVELGGPQAAAALRTACGLDLDQASDLGRVGQADGVEYWRHDQWGHPGLRAFGPPAALEALWENLLQAGARPLGETAFESLRLEYGQPGKGHELTDAHTPWEANLGRTIHMNKGCYIGQEVIARLDTYNKTKQYLGGLLLPEGDLPALGTPLKIDGRDVGRLTSAAFSLGLQRNIGLAYLRRAHTNPGIQVRLGDDEGPQAQIAELPLPRPA